MDRLPVTAVLPDLMAVLARQRSVVLKAPPGAGKTTGVPLALLGQDWRQPDHRIIVLEPRRLAARTAAMRMAGLLGESVGQTVGYRIRHDSRVGPQTLIEVVTEGLFIRQLQADPSLPRIAAVLFDEFHERHIESDLALALCLEVRAALREDLRLAVMSATLESDAVAKLLGNAPVISSDGRLHPVRTVHWPKTSRAPIETDVVAAIHDALQRETGDILVFLPGGAEIRRVHQRLADRSGTLIDPRGDKLRICPLAGDLSPTAQDEALQPAGPGARKVILATAIAETSLTIEGVRTVIDAGFMRVPRFDPRSGMTRLETVRISQASADQRRGRAGRLGPGVCYRLWPEAEHKALPAFHTPEIRSVDLAPLALELAVWGVSEAGRLAWLDPPIKAAMQQARTLLQELGALDPSGTVTPHGRAMAALGTHPRLAHMILSGHALGFGAIACALAALLEERDVLPAGSTGRDADLQHRLDLILPPDGRPDAIAPPPRSAIDATTLKRIRQTAAQYRRHLGAPPPTDRPSPDLIGLLVALAYPDRIARRRAGKQRSGTGRRYLLANGRGALLDESDTLLVHDWLAVAHLDGGQRDARIFLAAPFTPILLEQHCTNGLTCDIEISWDQREKTVVAVERRRFGALVLAETPLADPDPSRIADALMDGIRREGLNCLPWSDERRQWQARLACLRALEGAAGPWPDVSDTALLDSLETWLMPFVQAVRKPDAIPAKTFEAALDSLLPWPLPDRLAQDAPTHVQVPSGSRLRIDYRDPEGPVLAVKLQEMFGLDETPSVAGGRRPLLLHLLSPAGRPVQVTRDLAGFWQTAYAAVKSELRGRYPKHAWPDDPLTAAPTRRTKSRRAPDR